MFKYSGSHSKVTRAAKEATLVISRRDFQDKIKGQLFDMADCTSEVIIRDLTNFINAGDSMEVIVYRPAWRWSKALGYFSKSKPTKIFLNKYKLGRSYASISATLVHELIHCIDNRNMLNTYGHGTNSRIGKENTAPYWIGSLTHTILDGIAPVEPMENGRIKYFRWYNPLTWF